MTQAPRPALTRQKRPDAVDALAAGSEATSPPEADAAAPPAAPEAPAAPDTPKRRPQRPTSPVRPPAERRGGRKILVQVNTRLSLAVDEAMGEAVGEGRYPSKQALIEAAVRAELGLDAE